MAILKDKFQALSSNRKTVSLNDANFMSIFNNGTGAQYVSADVALQNSDIYSVVTQLSGDLATVKYKASKPRAQNILDYPSSTANPHGFWQSMFMQALLNGESFAYRWRNANGVDVRWEYLRPSQVSVFLLEDGSGLTYSINFDEPELGVLNNVPQNDMIHLRLYSKNGGKTGMSPLSALSNEINIKNLSNNLTKNALSQSVTSPGVLKLNNDKGLVNWKIKASHSREFMDQMKASNNGPIVIDGLEDWTPLEINSNVASLLASVNWTSTQVAKVYQVPDSYLNGTGDQQSSLDQIKGNYANALNRYAQAIVSELDNKLSASLTADIRPAIDPLGDDFATILAGLTKNGAIANNQATWVLQQLGYFPDNMPEAEVQPTQQVLIQSNSDKGGDDDDNSTD
ncbi:Phage portal protein [Lactiplantibacillus plantarum]|uniref:phage portal protein n=1 Tax=Lactiplantibacillus plantarum TaxID=1590 RepID=UPI0007B559D5|nr:phage portal protein [Lactiplantibacillus plantarum]KZU19541.1 Phage portal protein [Lactiplantibacillus plantarum]KZU31491.1 Phage portal protein [Lactiplantibacillus plantarum]